MQKHEYLKNEKSFLDEIKNIFHSFWGAIIWLKIKIWSKIADTSFKEVFSWVCQPWKILNYSSFQTVFPADSFIQ